MNNWGNKWDQWTDERKSKGGNALGIQTIALLLVTSYFTISYLFRAIQNYIIAAAGVAAFDVGALVWNHVYNHNASNQPQRDIADWMFKIDAAGMLLTTIAYLVPIASMPPIVHELTNWIVPIVFFVNVIAGILYKTNSDEIRLERESREHQAALAYGNAKAAQEMGQLSAQHTARQTALQHEQELLKLEQANTLLQMQLEAMRKGGDLAQTRGTHVEDAADGFARKTVENFKQIFGNHIAGNGNGHAPPPVKTLNAEAGALPNEEAR